MKKIEIVNQMKRACNTFGLRIKKHSPELLIVTGVIGVVASTVMACKATTKINTILDKAKEDIDKIHECVSDGAFATEYTVEDSKKDLAIVYAQTGMKIATLYAPALLLGSLSLMSILASNNILRKRNVAIAAAYTTLDKGFKEYRNRVVERFGEEVDHELKFNIKAKTFDTIGTDEKGEKKTTQETVRVADASGYSVYARFFDESCSGWEKDPEYSLAFLHAQQSYANDKLRASGHLFLNEVYDMLGIPRTKAGQVVGWLYDPNDQKRYEYGNSRGTAGDNYVDFGIYDTNREKVRDFVNGYERAILLDFNVDGIIFDLI